jgi:AcrR family transcriptional regulator
VDSAHDRPSIRGGRPRNADIDQAVLDATVEALDTVGYSHFTLEHIARRAGTSKPAIYRRWPTRERLVLAALAHRLGKVHVPDTGCTLCDLDDGLKLFADAFRRMPADVVSSLFADCARHPELARAFMTTLFEPLRGAVDAVLVRGIARGDLHGDINRQLLLDLLGSLVHYRALFRHAPIDDEMIETAVHTLCRGIAIDYHELVEHSRRLTGDPGLHRLHATPGTAEGLQ